MGRTGRPPKVTPENEAPVGVNLRGEHAALIRQYMAENGHSNAAQAVREILSIYFASLPLDGAVIAARDSAMSNTKHWLLTRLSIVFTELQQEMEANIRSIENSGYGK